MIAGTYLLSGLMLGATAALFDAGILTALTQTVAWVVVFFFASAGASAAYLTVSEIFPMETRALAIAFFYALGTGLGGIIGPVLFGSLIASNKPSHVAIGYVVGGSLMFATGIVEIFLGVDAEQMSLEDIAAPVSAEPNAQQTAGSTSDRTEQPKEAHAGGQTRGTSQPTTRRPPLPAVERARMPRSVWAPIPQASNFPRTDPYRRSEIERVVQAMEDAPWPVSYAELASRTGGRYWGPGRLRAAIRGAVYSGRIRPVGRDRYVLADSLDEAAQARWGPAPQWRRTRRCDIRRRRSQRLETCLRGQTKRPPLDGLNNASPFDAGSTTRATSWRGESRRRSPGQTNRGSPLLRGVSILRHSALPSSSWLRQTSP